MIIVCPECSTKFDVSSDRIPDGGIKVRCARCKHVFLAEKLPEEQAVPNEIAQSATEAPADESVDESSAEESDFSYDRFQELDSPSPDDENFSFDAGTDEQNGVTSTTDTTADDFTFEESVSPIEKVITAGDEEVDVTADESLPADEFQEQPTIAAPAEPEFPPQQEAKKKSNPTSSIIRILLLLIVAIVIIGGVFVYMNGTDQLNQTIQQIFGQQIDRPVQTGQITLTNLEGKFIKNEQVGEMFLIRGEAVNNFSEPRSAIQVKGVIFDQNGKPLLQKTVFCGNPIDDDKLQALSFEELEKIMGNQFGDGLSNMKIDSKKSIPFDIIFKDLPKNLSEFSVKVTSSKPATE